MSSVVELVAKTSTGIGRESAVVVSNGYILTDIAMQPNLGSIKKFKFDGSQDNDFTPVTNVQGLRGLEVNGDGTKLYAARNGGVQEYDLSNAGATGARFFDTSAHRVTKPASGCLSGDGQHLFITQQGWKFGGTGGEDPAVSDALLRVQL